MGVDACPRCGVSWIGEEIPPEQREMFDGATHFRREVAIYSLEKDRTVAYGCPDCLATFRREEIEK